MVVSSSFDSMTDSFQRHFDLANKLFDEYNNVLADQYFVEAHKIAVELGDVRKIIDVMLCRVRLCIADARLRAGVDYRPFCERLLEQGFALADSCWVFDGYRAKLLYAKGFLFFQEKQLAESIEFYRNAFQYLNPADIELGFKLRLSYGLALCKSKSDDFDAGYQEMVRAFNDLRSFSRLRRYEQMSPKDILGYLAAALELLVKYSLKEGRVPDWTYLKTLKAVARIFSRQYNNAYYKSVAQSLEQACKKQLLKL